ncbi:hypothetical protein [Cryptosporangium minutisporangium]|uniref:Uncharacterized protein n=1 Tax=Cryptosporangium minutisporangium TaxID=113569 RepID=A0ABP6STB5_9ACTN
MSGYIGSTVQEIEAAPNAELTADLLDRLKDLDATRINKDDQIVMRKAVLGLLSIVSTLEARIAELESR